MFDIIKKLKNTEIQSKALTVKSLVIQKINSIPELTKIYSEIKETDEELYKHCISVADISCVIGILYNLRLDELISLYLGSIFHDNGKTLLNQEILYKPEKFSADEKQLIEAHTSLGYKRIKCFLSDEIVLDIILKHHERLDGSGYPNGLAESEQSIFVKIVAVADVFHALISKRCYKKPMEIKEAFGILENDVGLEQIIVTIYKNILSC